MSLEEARDILSYQSKPDSRLTKSREYLTKHKLTLFKQWLIARKPQNPSSPFSAPMWTVSR